MAKKTLKIFKAICIFTIAHFISFVVFSLVIGGDALNGYVNNGHYFVANHGKYTEVPKIIWVINKMQAISFTVTFPVGMISGVILNINKKNICH